MFAVLFALFLAVFFPILAVRFHFYMETPRYSHCVLLPFVSALWVWERWDALRATPRTISISGLGLIAFGVLTFLYGRLLHHNFIQHFGMLMTAAGLVWGLAGSAILRATAFPLAYLALMIPLPPRWDDRITAPLQRIATVMAETFFEALGWVVVRQGNVLQLPRLKLLVEEQCSGAHSLYALGALAIAWVFFVERPVWLRIVLIASTVPIAIVANAIRVSATGVLAYKVDPSYAQGLSHQTAGILVFGIGVVLLLGLDWCLKPDPPQRMPIAPPSLAPAAPPADAAH